MQLLLLAVKGDVNDEPATTSVLFDDRRDDADTTIDLLLLAEVDVDSTDSSLFAEREF